MNTSPRPKRHYGTTALCALVGLFLMAGCGGETEEVAAVAEQTAAAREAQAAPQETPSPRPRPTLNPKGKVVILGFDGVEPSIVEKMMDAGELPNLAKLRDAGTFTRLESSNPPQSPTAWSSFATAKNPGNHGIYDFLKRDPKTYLPGVGFGIPVHAKLAPDGSVSTPAKGINYRQGETFWSVADRQGARCKVLSMPFAFPPDDLEHGLVLSGLGVPDIRGTTSTFVTMATNFTKEELGSSVSGGMRLALNFAGDTATVMVPGARDPRVRRATYIEVPITFQRNQADQTLKVDIEGQSDLLREGAWSKWFEWTFKITPKFSVKAISRIHVLELKSVVRLYMTCLQFHPKDPYIPFSFPKSYTSELADRYGNFKTIGWAYDTHALRQDAMTDDLFLDDIANTMTWRERLTLDEMDGGEYDLLISVWTGTDRVSHLFWRYRDEKHPRYTKEGAARYGRAVETTYEKMDEIVGKVRAKLDDNDLLIVMSDHGFHSFRRGFNVNTWLIRNGYLAVEGKTDAKTSYNNKAFLQGYDWNRTQAYSLGLGSIFLNQEGRERDGTVAPKKAGALINEIREKLLRVTDPKTGEKVFRAIYTRDDYSGTALANAPDIQLGYAEGYQSTKNAAKGAAPAELFQENDDKWSGEHAASDRDFTPGIFFSNKKVLGEPSLVDMGVLALTHMNALVPPDFEGRALSYSSP